MYFARRKKIASRTIRISGTLIVISDLKVIRTLELTFSIAAAQTAKEAKKPVGAHAAARRPLLGQRAHHLQQVLKLKSAAAAILLFSGAALPLDEGHDAVDESGVEALLLGVDPQLIAPALRHQGHHVLQAHLLLP